MKDNIKWHITWNDTLIYVTCLFHLLVNSTHVPPLPLLFWSILRQFIFLFGLILMIYCQCMLMTLIYICFSRSHHHKVYTYHSWCHMTSRMMLYSVRCNSLVWLWKLSSIWEPLGSIITGIILKIILLVMLLIIERCNWFWDGFEVTRGDGCRKAHSLWARATVVYCWLPLLINAWLLNEAAAAALDHGGHRFGCLLQVTHLCIHTIQEQKSRTT